MGDLPYYFWLIVVVGTFFIVSEIFLIIIILIQNNRKLKQEKDFTSFVLDNINELSVILGERGNVLFINRKARGLFNLNKEVLLENISDNSGLNQLAARQDSSETTSFETIYKNDNESQSTVVWSKYKYQGLNDRQFYTVFAGNDITEIKEARATLSYVNNMLEARIAQRTEEVRIIISQAPFGMIILNKNGSVVQINDSLSNMIISGYAIDDGLVGKNYFENSFISNEVINKNVMAVFFDEGSYTSPIVSAEGIIPRIPLNPNIHWVVLRAYSVKDISGDLFRVVLLIEDVSEQKNNQDIQQKLIENQIRTSTILETIESERKRIAQDLHDSVQQLLTGAKLKIETFEMRANTKHPLIEESINAMLAASGEIRNIINDMQPLEIEKYGLISALRNYAMQIMKLNNIELFFFNRYERTLPEIYNLPVYRIFQESLNNIVKHSKAGKADILIYEDNHYFAMKISDNGIGFEQDRASDKTIKGRGLGHIILRVENLGGTININSSQENGTILLIKLPLDKYEEN